MHAPCTAYAILVSDYVTCLSFWILMQYHFKHCAPLSSLFWGAVLAALNFITYAQADVKNNVNLKEIIVKVKIKFCSFHIIQCVHKVYSGFRKIVARKQIELATCGLRQITAKLWKFFFVADRWNKRPSLRFSVSCLWNGDCAGTRALCGKAFWSQEKWQTGCERWMCGNNPCIVCTKPYKIHTRQTACG
jgi:hypothetical protein